MIPVQREVEDGWSETGNLEEMKNSGEEWLATRNWPTTRIPASNFAQSQDFSNDDIHSPQVALACGQNSRGIETFILSESW